MQFVNNGPNIPEKLLLAHEKGELVLFCGAGISLYAGLPDFKNLVKNVYILIGEGFEDLEKIEFRKNNFDRVLGLFEDRLSKSKHNAELRNSIKKLLTVNKKDLIIHKAIIEIGTQFENKVCRVVTTNFDNCFEIIKDQYGFQTNIGPLILNTPKKDNWNSLVYLHGLCGDNPESECRNIILTSA